MLLKRLALVVVAALCLWGCQKGGDDERVAQLLDRQEGHARQISDMSRKIDGLDDKLSDIEKSVNALLGGASATRSAKGQELIVKSNFAETEEYQDIMRQIATLHGQVGTVQEGFAGFQQEQKEAEEVAALRDRGGAFRAMSDPNEMSRRLDILAKNFSGRISDAATRSQFAADVENMKAKFSASLSPGEKLEQARALLTQTMNAADDDRARGWMEAQLRSLDEADPNQLEERVERVLQMQRMRDIGEMTQKYNIPQDVVRDSGIVSFGRGGPRGFGPGMGRRGR